METGDEDAEVTAALAAADAAFGSVRAREDDPAKFKAISQMAEGFRKLGEAAAAERPGIVRRYRDRQQLALAPLAKQLAMSKTRVHQLYVAAKEGTGHV